MSEDIGERDKPFILALSTLGAFLSVVFVTLYLKEYGLLEEVAKWFIPLLTMSWTFYFSKKAKGT